MKSLLALATVLFGFLAGCGGGGAEQSDGAYLRPELVSSELTFTVLESSGQHACGVTKEGGTYCWGADEHGELGVTGILDVCHDPLRGSFYCTGTPTFTEDARGYVDLAAAQWNGFTCGLTAEGATYCWGFKWGFRDSSGVEEVAGELQFVSITADPGGWGACGLTAAGELYCWGSLGIIFGEGRDPAYAAPTRVAPEYTFVSFDLGDQYACGVTTAGQAYCWGNNWYGQLGIGSAGGNGGVFSVATPTAVVGGHIFHTIVAGLQQTCALTPSGAAYCWGDGNNIGAGSYDGYVPTPQPVVGGLNFLSLYAGNVHTCGLTADGEAYCWGQNYLGELGDGTQISRNAPVKVQFDQRFVRLSNWPNCGLNDLGQAYCWGDNAYGQVGKFPFYAEQ